MDSVLKSYKPIISDQIKFLEFKDRITGHQERQVINPEGKLKMYINHPDTVLVTSMHGRKKIELILSSLQNTPTIW